MRGGGVEFKVVYFALQIYFLINELFFKDFFKIPTKRSLFCNYCTLIFSELYTFIYNYSSSVKSLM